MQEKTFVQKYYFSWGSCRNITVPSYCDSGFLCRAFLGVVQKCKFLEKYSPLPNPHCQFIIISNPTPFKVLRSMDFHVITFDYRGFADSSKHIAPTETGVVKDARVVYDWLRSRAGGKVVHF